ncbi:MAG: aspartate aminotransferase family protein, partial [Chlamydiia bacterium]|nr:aspartate aminotransferase family protein [Chlamydiia bacterium]
PIQEALQGKNGTVQHIASMFTLFFRQRSVSNFEEAKQIDTQAYSALFRFLFARGIYFPPSPFEACFLSSQHTDEQIDKTVEAVVAFLKDWQ